MRKGISEIVILLAVAFFGIASLPIVGQFDNQGSPTPTPIATPSPEATSSPEPTNKPTVTPMGSDVQSVTVPVNGSVDIERGNSSVHIENNGSGSDIHVETNGSGSATVHVENRLKSYSTSNSTNETVVTTDIQ